MVRHPGGNAVCGQLLGRREHHFVDEHVHSARILDQVLAITRFAGQQHGMPAVIYAVAERGLDVLAVIDIVIGVKMREKCCGDAPERDTRLREPDGSATPGIKQQRLGSCFDEEAWPETRDTRSWRASAKKGDSQVRLSGCRRAGGGSLISVRRHDGNCGDRNKNKGAQRPSFMGEITQSSRLAALTCRNPVFGIRSEIID